MMTSIELLHFIPKACFSNDLIQTDKLHHPAYGKGGRGDGHHFAFLALCQLLVNEMYKLLPGLGWGWGDKR